MGVLFSCSYNKEELPVPVVTNTAPTVTYSNFAKSIIDNNCIGCHPSSAGLDLTSYQNVKAIVDNGSFKTRVIDGNPTFMPPSGAMSQNILDSLQLWINQGAHE